MTDSILRTLTHAIEQAPGNVLSLGRWVDRSKELQKEFALRVMSLSLYMDELPESSYASYADALEDVLLDTELKMSPFEVSDLINKAQEFAKRLEDRGYADKATMIRKAIEQKSNKTK